MAQRKSRKTTKPARLTYNAEYRTEALKLADTIGVAAAAEQLGIQSSQIYSWRSKARLSQSQSSAEKALLAENAKLKRQLAERNEEVDILKKPRHTCVTNTVSATWCCLSDGSRSPELSLQGAGSNRQMLLCPKGMVVSDLLKAADLQQQVCIGKTSESEPFDDPSKC